MSMKHTSSDFPETLWWAQQQNMMELPAKTSSPKYKNFMFQPQLYPQDAMFCNQKTASLNFNLNNEDDEDVDEQEKNGKLYHEAQEISKELLFEKPLTPSDVGKLNRLVIPKQHAEKYFPLNGDDSGEKGMLLNFEDELGKSWRFRYSYWNSSQSYVLTKGWSRFVKEKKLDAGDIILFQRHRTEYARIFIGWRRRKAGTAPVGGVAPPAAMAGNNTGWTRVFYSGHPYLSHSQRPAVPYPSDCLHAGSAIQNQTTPSGSSRKLRLFGVNLECKADESEPSTPDDGSSMSRQGHTQYHQFYSKYYTYNHQNHMDINFSCDINQ